MAVGPPGPNNQGPALSVMAAFGQNPFLGSAASYTWTDLSAYVLSYKSQGGRQHELSRFEARTTSILLDNTDGRFSPYNTSSPYYPNIVPSTPVWVQAVYSGASYGRFFGYVDDWTMQWVGPGYSNVMLDATDSLGILSLFEFGQTTSPYPALVLADGGANLVYYWRCGDVVGSSIVADSSGLGNNGMITNGAAGGASFGFQGAMPYDPNTAVDLTNDTQTPNAGIETNGATANPPSTVEMWCLAAGSINTAGAVLGSCAQGAGPSYGTSLIVNSSGTVTLNDYYNSESCTSSAVVNDRNWHHLVGTVGGTGASVWNLYVDGALAGTFNGNAGTNARLAFDFIGSALPGEPIGSTTAWPGSLDEIALYSIALTPTQVLNHYTVGSYFRRTELTGSRVSDCLAQIPIGASGASIAAGWAECAPETNAVVGTKVLDYIGTVTDTEPSSFWQDGNGYLVFPDKFWALNQTSSALTFSDDPAVPGVMFEMGSPDLAIDALDLWPTVTVTRNNGVIQTATNAAALARYGPRQDDISGVLYTNDGDSLNLANWYSNLYGTPVQRVSGVEVALYSRDGSTALGGAHVAAVLGLKFLQRVTVRKRTQDAGTAFQQDSCVESISETVTAGPTAAWQVTFALSPYDIDNGEVLIWSGAVQNDWDDFDWGP